MRTAALLGILAALALPLVAPASPAPGATAAPISPGPSVVEIPYEGTVDVTPAPGWQFADCAPLQAATPWVTACSAGGFTAAAPTFDPEAPPVRVAVPMAGPAGVVAIDYVLRLGPPPAPDAGDSEVPVPLRAGGHLLVPLVELGLSCGLCTPGIASIRVEGVDPVGSVTARVTGSHLSLAAGAQAQGTAEVALRVIDDIGAASTVFLVRVHIVTDRDAGLLALHRALPAPDAPLSFTLADLAFLPPGTEGVTLVGCSAAVHGTVTCQPDGSVDYRPVDVQAGDQFSFVLSTRRGRLALGSVTFVDAPGGLAAGAGAAEAPLTVVLPVPVEPTDEQGGATRGFTDVFDQMGVLP